MLMSAKIHCVAMIMILVRSRVRDRKKRLQRRDLIVRRRRPERVVYTDSDSDGDSFADEMETHERREDVWAARTWQKSKEQGRRFEPVALREVKCASSGAFHAPELQILAEWDNM
ncbi:hypothetical protein HKX48_005514 [Thoreauomyces humboldtii]|nr:hypothetical protein HKX48_005514 [Thoreauomyces humboldtii]